MSEEAKYNYEAFARTAEYRDVNRKMVAAWVAAMLDSGVKRVERLLDIATGIGTMVRLFLEELPEDWEQPEIICLDKSQGALELAKKKLGAFARAFSSICTPIQDMEISDKKITVALWGNGIHNLSEEDQAEAVKRIAKNLEEQGWFFFNTSFYEGARPKGTKSFYRFQVRKAVELLREKGIKRKRGKERAEASKFHPVDHYRSLIKNSGLSIQQLGEETAPLYRDAWMSLSGFKNYALGALHGYPVEEAQIAMQKAVDPALEKYGLKDDSGNLYIPRRWLKVAARLT